MSAQGVSQKGYTHMTTQTRQRVPKAVITRLLHRAGLADFTTKQMGSQVLLTCNTADVAHFEHALRVAGFSFDFATVRKIVPESSVTVVTHGLLCSLQDYTADKINLIVSLRWTEQQVDEFITAVAAATVKAGA